MRKILKTIRFIVLSGLFLSAICQNAKAFMPPVPGMPSLDIPNNVGKAWGVVQQNSHTIKAVLTGDYSAGLQAVKSMLPNLPSIINEVKKYRKKGQSNTPGSSKVAGNSTLGISENSVDEEEFFNAFSTLFLTSDSSDMEHEIKKKLYGKKAIEFKQDMAINAYVTAKTMESYLETIEQTLARLEKCQNGELEGSENCTFFGLTMEKVEADAPTEPTNSDEESDNTAQLGAARNAYIVATVQDRLLRIIEELTALEAVFQSSRQLDIADPTDINEKNSSADEYIDAPYQFAYNSTKEHTSAKGTPAIKFNNRIKMCDGKSNDPRCPSVNKTKAKIEVMADTSALEALPTIEEYIDNAVAIHNLKSMMYQYKIKYRQYLLQKKIHDDAKKLVENSDKCVVDFLKRHSEGADNEPLVNALQIWYGGDELYGNKRFDYANRQGLSGNLLKIYDEKSSDIAIGSSSDCRGYYEENSCPSGYVRNEKKCCKTNEKLCACEVELATEDFGMTETQTTLDSDPIGGTAVARINTDREDTDGFINGTKAEEIKKGSKESQELTWNLGKDAILKTLENQDNKLKFSPWTDQKVLQEEYLRNKYRNIRLIIESTDQGIVSYKLASKRAGQQADTNAELAPYIKAITSCLGMDEAKEKEKQKWCTGSYKTCIVTDAFGKITTTVERKIGVNSSGDPIYKTETHEATQIVSLSNNKCNYKRTEASDMDAFCLTPGCMVKKYFTKKWPEGANGFYKEITDKGRIVAMDKLQDAIKERTIQEQNVYKLVSDNQRKIEAQEKAIRTAIERQITINQDISKLKETKNNTTNELQRTDKRIKSITDEINQLLKRKENLSKAKNKKDIDEIDKKIKELEAEKAYLENDGKDIPNCQYTPRPRLKEKLEALDKRIESKEESLKGLKDIVKQEQEKLEDLKTDFAEVYLEAEENAQKAIEDKNLEYERFLDPNVDDGYSTYNEGSKKTYRMRNGKNTSDCYDKGFLGICTKHGPQRIKEDNLSSTITEFIRKGTLNEVMKAELTDIFFPLGVKKTIEQFGVPNKFYVDSTFNAIGVAGDVTSSDIAALIQDAVIEIAANKLETIINDADKDVANLLKESTNEVKEFAKQHKIDGESNKMPTEAYLMSPSAAHAVLLEKLRNLSDGFISEGVENLFGIPSDGDFSQIGGIKDHIDESYFVALPARGNNYSNKLATDTNAGRDFAAPKGMLSSLPPLREVFYFRGADYETFPKDKNGKPVLTELLQCKTYNQITNVCQTEYLPEVWLHLLARPNLREDHKYWQTFVERSFGGTKQLNKLVQNQIANASVYPTPKDSDYRAIIARSGVYPCKITNGKYIDLIGGDNIKDMKFKIRDSLPVGVPEVNCQDVSLSGNTVKHLLADKKFSTEKEDGTTEAPMYTNHSELGQLLTKDLKYRPLQENIQKFLLNVIKADGKKNKKGKETLENNIARQKAEGASFKRNVMGSFLDAITKEYHARKNLEQSKQSIAETLQSLCQQIENLKVLNTKEKPVIDGCKELIGKDDLSIVADIEKATVIDNKLKLATSYDADNKYYEGDERSNGIECNKAGGNLYKKIFCMLDEEKNNYINAATVKLNSIKNKTDRIINSKANGYEYIEERLNKINSYIGAKGSLIIDDNEVTTILPDKEPNVKNGIADRNVEITTAEEGLEAMVNQSQAVAYCPIY